ncbi:hypothetical protein ACFPMF_24320 [Larkinella bovis]|uniref:Uncharacterized protein n=1 Tax=Larkinella bovis TaxID=683041 RepID=A0ABW0IJ64_9BACT
MNKQSYRTLTEEHFCHQLWQNDLIMAEQELTFFEHLLDQLNPIGLPNSPGADYLDEILSNLHHFNRLIPVLKQDIQQTEKQLATDVKATDNVSAAQKKDHAYLRSEMDDFEQSYRQFKQTFRTLFTSNR